MFWTRTDDPVRDAERYFTELERQAEERLEKLPVCSECGCPIEDDWLYEFNDELICPECLEENHMKKTEDYVN